MNNSCKKPTRPQKTTYIRFTPPKTNECPLKRDECSIGNTSSKNWWFSGDMLFFRKVHRGNIPCATRKKHGGHSYCRPQNLGTHQTRRRASTRSGSGNPSKTLAGGIGGLALKRQSKMTNLEKENGKKKGACFIRDPYSPGQITLQGINISHLGKRKIIFKMPFWGDMLVPWRVYYLIFHQPRFPFEIQGEPLLV